MDAGLAVLALWCALVRTWGAGAYGWKNDHLSGVHAHQPAHACPHAGAAMIEQLQPWHLLGTHTARVCAPGTLPVHHAPLPKSPSRCQTRAQHACAVAGTVRGHIGSCSTQLGCTTFHMATHNACHTHARMRAATPSDCMLQTYGP